MTRVATLLGILLLLGGCRVQEYVVSKDEVPLYATPACDQVVDRLPLGHHERIIDDDGKNGAVKVEFNGRVGWVKKGDLRVLAYMHPDLDEGNDREETIGRAVREVAVDHAGSDWSDDVRDAVKSGRVVEGMSREQVELAWGWPRTIEPLASPMGGERWIYRRRGYETFDTTVAAARRFRPARPSTPRWMIESPSSYYRMPVIEERVVEFHDRVVVRSFVRRYYDVDGWTTEDES